MYDDPRGGSGGLMEVYLDGVPVEADRVTPSRHRFIGTFRPPQAPQAMLLCPCTEWLRSHGTVHQHWREGHFDVPMYVSVDRGTA